MKKILGFIVLGALIGAMSASADVFTPAPSEDYHYIFAFDYKGNNLSAQKPAYSIMTGPRAAIISGAYVITVKNRAGKDLVAVAFNPSAMADADHVVRVPVPYQPSGVRAVVTESTGTVAVQIDVSLSSTCNDDSVCDVAVGEDMYNCPVDCPKTATSPKVSQSPSTSPQISTAVSENSVSTSSKKRWGLILLALLAGSGAMGVGLVLHRYRSQRQ